MDVKRQNISEFLNILPEKPLLDSDFAVFLRKMKI